MSFDEKLSARVAEVEQIVSSYLPKEEGYQKTVLEAMNYSVLAGGKRLRPMMMQEAYRLHGGDGKVIEPFMAAIEMIHTYSLVHDDLPAMDNDQYRRGKLTTHAAYGEAMAILAGDGLLNYAFETACKAFEIAPGVHTAIGKALTVLSRKAGIYGMIGGQVADVEAEKKGLRIDEDKLMFIHAHKTAALIEASLMCGAILAGASGEDVRDMETVGYNIGLAFQIQDDILDVTGNEAELGKPIGSDEKNDKLTYVKAHGLTEAAAQVEKLSAEAIALLQKNTLQDDFLIELTRALVHRTK
ncbi:MAG: polyprenyl synthetase family protein [Lachnospiraceae bacterium]|nr:polyprenyl synthetase family protein [Lachnospiraceae bacterium]